MGENIMAVDNVFPAYAGMIPAQQFIFYLGMSVPRIRGDDPTIAGINAQVQQCSPHTRG